MGMVFVKPTNTVMMVTLSTVMGVLISVTLRLHGHVIW